MRVIRLGTLVLVCFFAALFATAFNTVVRAEAGEYLVVPFSSGTTGVETVNSYTGAVTITVSGTGQAAGSQRSDAFYIYTDSSGQSVAPWHPTPPNGYNWILWINGGPSDKYVNPIPLYNSDHTYTFSITSAGSKIKFSFGVGDAGSYDNTGAYNITVKPGITTGPVCSPPSTLSNGTAYVFIDPTRVFDLLRIGHVAWGFETCSGRFSYGSTDGSGSLPYIFPGFSNGWWMISDSTSTNMLKKMKDLGYRSYKTIKLNNSYPRTAYNMAIDTGLIGYSVFGSNCADHSRSIMSEYGVKNLPSLAFNWNPTDWFNNLSTADGWSASRSL